MHLCAPSFIRHWYHPHQPPLFSNLLWLCTIWRVALLFQTAFPPSYFNLLACPVSFSVKSLDISRDFSFLTTAAPPRGGSAQLSVRILPPWYFQNSACLTIYIISLIKTHEFLKCSHSNVQ
jgi:hypothetical protein